MPILVVILTTLIGGVAGYNIHGDDNTCDSAELAFHEQYVTTQSLINIESDPQGSGYATVYGNPVTGPEFLHIYVVAEAVSKLKNLTLVPLGVCLSGTGQQYSHFAVTALPPRPIKTATPQMPDL